MKYWHGFSYHGAPCIYVYKITTRTNLKTYLAISLALLIQHFTVSQTQLTVRVKLSITVYFDFSASNFSQYACKYNYLSIVRVLNNPVIMTDSLKVLPNCAHLNYSTPDNK